MRIVKAFWGGHIDLGHVAYAGPVRREGFDFYFDIKLLLCDKPLTVYAPTEAPDDLIEGEDDVAYFKRKRQEFVEQWGGE